MKYACLHWAEGCVLRQEADGYPPQPLRPWVKQLEIHSLWTRNSKMRTAGQLRETAGPCPGHICLILQVHMKALCRSKGGVTSRDAFYPWTFSVESILAKRRMCTQKRILRYSRYGLWMGQIEMTGLRKTRRNAPSKWFKIPRGNNAGLLPLSLPFYLSTCTVFFLLIHTSLASLLSLFVGILFCKAEAPEPLSLATALVTGIWCFLHYNRAGNPSPTQAVAGWGHLRLI